MIINLIKSVIVRVRVVFKNLRISILVYKITKKELRPSRRGIFIFIIVKNTGYTFLNLIRIKR